MLFPTKFHPLLVFFISFLSHSQSFQFPDMLFPASLHLGFMIPWDINSSFTPLSSCKVPSCPFFPLEDQFICQPYYFLSSFSSCIEVAPSGIRWARAPSLFVVLPLCKEVYKDRIGNQRKRTPRVVWKPRFLSPWLTKAVTIFSKRSFLCQFFKI